MRDALQQRLSGLDGPALRTVLRSTEALPDRVRRRLLPPAQVDDQVLCWRWQLSLALQRRLLPAMHTLSVPACRRHFRRSMDAMANEPTPSVISANITVPGATGPLPARRYQPTDRGSTGTLLYWHGGGFVIGDLDTHDATCRRLSRSGLTVISACYRTAPEHPFPAAPHDALATFEALAVDTPRLAVGGDSAGGNLAAVVARETARRGTVTPFAQLLFYPGVDLLGRRRSHQLFSADFGLELQLINWFMGHYLPIPELGRGELASPLLHAVPDGLPPAYIALAGFDPLRDEGREYAAHLETAGVDVELSEHPEQIHGFVNAVDLMPDACAAVDRGGRWLAQRFRDDTRQTDA